MKSARAQRRHQELHPSVGASAPRKDELAFLPAALEIVETPPSPIGRAIGALIVVLFLPGVDLGQLRSRSISSPRRAGKIVPSGRTKMIQPFETGVVRAIHVQDGQSVKAGDILIELDPTMTTADEEHISNDLVAAQLDIARARAALERRSQPTRMQFHAARGCKPRCRSCNASSSPSDRGTACQDRLARSPAGAKRSRARDCRGHDRRSSRRSSH